MKRPPYSGRQLVAFCLLYAAGAWPLMSGTDDRRIQAIGAVVIAVVAFALVALISRHPRGGASVLALVAIAGALAVQPAAPASAATWTPGRRHVYAAFEAHAPIGGPNFFRVNTDSYGCWAANGYLTGVRLSAEVQIEYAGILAGYEGAGHASLSSITHYHWSSSNPNGSTNRFRRTV